MPMNGIDKVAARIVSDAQQEATALKAEAEARAREQKENADRHAAELRQSLLAEADAEAKIREEFNALREAAGRSAYKE